MTRARWRSIAWMLLFFAAQFAYSPRAAASLRHKKKNEPRQETLGDYIARAKQWSAPAVVSTGSLWSPDARLGNFVSDDKAYRVGDVISIQLVESATSAQQGSVQTQRTIAASSGISELFGTPGARSGIQNLFTPNSSQTVNGKGQTALTTSLQTTVAGTVVDVLPSGQLVVEARHIVEVTNEKQTMVLRGIVRPTDISSSNIILSTQLAHMEVTMTGKGAMSDGIRPPNPVTRWLLWILGF